MNETLEQTLSRLTQVFQTIDLQRMQDLPLRNGELAVEAVGFRLYQEHLLGVLITPWFMNLVMLPLREADKTGLKAGEKTQWRFPGETVEFMSSPLPKFGWIQSAALYSSVSGFASQDAAREVAREALNRLLEPADTNNDTADPHVRKSAGTQATISRRDLLRGLLRRGD